MKDVVRPIIGISASVTVEHEGVYSGYERNYVCSDYIEAVIRAGGIPYILPIVEEEDIIKSQVDNIDGLILTGGHDVNPLFWGEEPLCEIEETIPKRDEFDINLVKYARESNKPILGVCRGHQIINIAFEGTLYQDISYAKGKRINHNQKSYYDIPTHSISIDKESVLREILGEKDKVNSFHHISINKLGEGLKISAIAPDGIIEAIESEEDNFILGVQWHPEMLSKRYKNMQKIFDVLVTESIKRI